MPKPELGARRRCLTCAAAFFDLNKSPIFCVKCGAEFHVVELPRAPPRRVAAARVVAPAERDEAEPGDAADGDNDSAGEESILDPVSEDEDDDARDIVPAIAADEPEG